MASSPDKLDELQRRVLETLAGIEPPFVLSGGAALAGVHLGHRTTRDLDLFWRSLEILGDLPELIGRKLEEAGLSVATIQKSPAFVRLRVTNERSAVLIDLIAESAESIESPMLHTIGSAEILVDSRRAILAEKLCALLERSEIRDLIDVKALVESGENLEQALADAPRRDAGFSSLTLAWVLRDFNIKMLAQVAGLDNQTAADLDAFRLTLIGRLIPPQTL